MEVTTIQGGSEKTVFSPYIPFTAAQLKQLQDEIAADYQEFKSAVTSARGNVAEQFMQGQAFTGVEALNLRTNLIDGLCNNISQLVQAISN